MKHANSERRIARRKAINGVSVSNITALRKFALIARLGVVVDVSSTGILLHVNRKDLVPKQLKGTLTLGDLEGEPIMIRIAVMDLDIDGTISRTKHIGGGVFEVALDFSADAPEYWRECLVDLLPEPGEMDEDNS